MLTMGATCRLLTLTQDVSTAEIYLGLFGHYSCSSTSYRYSTSSSCSRECYVYESEVVDTLDSSFKAARGCAGTAMGLGGVAMILGWVAGCVDFGKWYYILLGSIYVLCVLFAGLSFLIFNTEWCDGVLPDGSEFAGVSCKPEGELAVPIVAILLWIVAAVAIFIFPRRSSDHVAEISFQDEVHKSVEKPAAQAPTQVTTEEVLEDGTRVVKTVIYE